MHSLCVVRAHRAMVQGYGVHVERSATMQDHGHRKARYPMVWKRALVLVCGSEANGSCEAGRMG